MNKAQIRRENAWMDRTGGGEHRTQRIKTKYILSFRKV